MKRFTALLLILVLTVTACTGCFQATGTESGGITYGDVNQNRSVGADDALLALKASVHRITLTGEAFTRADVDGSGRVDAADALLILKYAVHKITVFPVADDGLAVHYIDVGQGDSIFVELPGPDCMLIDAGEKEYGATVSRYIQSLGYQTITYLVATHNHSDHIGGLPAVIGDFNVRSVYVSADTATSACYKKFCNAVTQSGAKKTVVKAGSKLLDTADLDITVEAPVTCPSGDPNNASVVLLLTYKKVSFLFMGDAGTKEEATMAKNITADVVKIGHHGSRTSSGRAFVNQVHATFGILSLGKDNSYGHPHEESVTRWQNAGVKLFRTDQLGTITVTTDGNTITLNENRVSASPDVQKQSEPAVTYVLNTSSKKFHLPSCGSVAKMKDENKTTTAKTAAQLQKEGYAPCGSCLPDLVNARILPPAVFRPAA